MGVLRSLRNLTRLTVGTAAVASGGWYYLTYQSRFEPYQPPSDTGAADSLFSSSQYKRFNPEDNKTMHDMCVRRVPLKNLKPELVEEKGRLVEAFCQGIYGGIGYSIQRYYLSRKYKSAHPDQLWSLSSLRSSSYPVGTKITDHFEVIAHTPESITVRCGDSPLKTEVRESDGLFEMVARVDEGQDVAVFELKSLFFQGLGRSVDEPMPPWIQFLHRVYTKIWMEAAVRSCLKQ
ncbi:MAG: hypothetical protein M1819_003277 [Sarea resinae]|nr:MAG: hypothetical protein M1819_003277 [Sarea resinae]